MLLGMIAFIVIGSMLRGLFLRPPYYSGGYWNRFHGPMHHEPRDMHHGSMGPHDMGGRPHGPRW